MNASQRLFLICSNNFGKFEPQSVSVFITSVVAEQVFLRYELLPFVFLQGELPSGPTAAVYDEYGERLFQVPHLVQPQLLRLRLSHEEAVHAVYRDTAISTGVVRKELHFNRTRLRRVILLNQEKGGGTSLYETWVKRMGVEMEQLAFSFFSPRAWSNEHVIRLA